jgi:hypothetical protein
MLIQTKDLKILFFILASLFLVIIIYLRFNTNFSNENNTSCYNSIYNGKVKLKYKDWDKHRFPELILDDNSSVFMYKEIYDSIQIGDIIIKNKKSFNLMVIKKNNDTLNYNLSKLLDVNNIN